MGVLPLLPIPGTWPPLMCLSVCCCGLGHMFRLQVYCQIYFSSICQAITKFCYLSRALVSQLQTTQGGAILDIQFKPLQRTDLLTGQLGHLMLLQGGCGVCHST